MFGESDRPVVETDLDRIGPLILRAMAMPELIVDAEVAAGRKF